MKLIVGLGNIGDEYSKTNHNAGFMIVDKLAEKCGFTFKNRGCEADYAEYNSGKDKFIIAKPRTYMNESGKSVKSFMKKFDIDLEDVMIISDDIDTEPGHIRIRKSGSAGTHNGLKSVIAETGSTEFKRLRVGIGRQQEHQDLANFVLGKMRMTDEQKMGLDKALDALYDYVDGVNIDNIISKYNG
ncbi:MAG: aminoacyl-tRNA hydrolase [Clostridia bacterium]|nr:aminoacyl-tRNA hydrolase [Clostridia bacterium]